MKLKQRDQNVQASKADLKAVTDKLNAKENEISKALAAKLESEQKTQSAIDEVWQELETEKD